METSKLACERFFRLYYKHCLSPDLDTLFNLLNSIHSLNDKLNRNHKLNFFDCNEFIALKALRNLFHHQEELLNELRVIPVEKLPEITTDLLYLCLVPRALVLKSIESINKKFRDNEEKIIRSTLGWFGEVVNINPCIFNFAVKVFEKVYDAGFDLSSEEYNELKSSYEFEEQNDHSHFVTGTISCHAGNVEEVLRIAYANIT